MLGNTVCGLTTLVGPVVGEVMPSRARFDAGPVALTVHGNFFDLGGAPSLTFGGLPASNVQVVLLPGISGEFCLPQAHQMLVVPSWPFDALTISLPIPTNPVLSGLRILGQAVTATGIPATAALSNCTSFYLP